MYHIERYKRNPVVDYPEREWPNKQIEKAPIWCSVDLRDGNQALVEPMVVEEKMEMFSLLLKLGFKEIEIGFPAASQIEFDFLRQLSYRKAGGRNRTRARSCQGPGSGCLTAPHDGSCQVQGPARRLHLARGGRGHAVRLPQAPGLQAAVHAYSRNRASSLREGRRGRGEHSRRRLLLRPP